MPTFTPREIVSELDRYIVGQRAAKRAVAIALRNRWRRLHVPEPLRDEIAHRGTAPAKPNPTGLLRVLAVMDIEPSTEKVFYVGDLERDATTAGRARVAFAWAAYGYGDHEPRCVASVIHRPTDLIKL